MELDTLQKMDEIDGKIKLLNSAHLNLLRRLASDDAGKDAVPPRLNFDSGDFSLTYQGNVTKFTARHVRISETEYMREYLCSVRFREEDILLWKFYLAADSKLWNEPNVSHFDHASNPEVGLNIRLRTMKLLIESKVFAI